MRSNGENKSEIFKGDCYRSLLYRFLHGNSFSCTINTDGLIVQKSNRYSIWPIFCSINELDFYNKTKFIACCGIIKYKVPCWYGLYRNLQFTVIWVGNTKPKPETFFKPFVSEAQLLYKHGFEWRNSKIMK